VIRHGPKLLTQKDVVWFWLGEPGSPPLAKEELWWKKDEAFDHEIRVRFEATLEGGLRGELATWRENAHGRLALVLLYDQMSRNMFRGTARAFAQDANALEVAEQALAAGDEHILTPVEVSFLLMPFSHAEDLTLQKRSVAGFRKLCDAASEELHSMLTSSLDFALQHQVIVERFGRFPHRNAILGRANTAAEEEFLTRPGSSF
jgi:uncharacterized protein (DUF924 family)